MGYYDDMNRSTLTMGSSAFENPLMLHRSQSTPDFFAPLDKPSAYGSNKALPDLPVEAEVIDFDFDDTGFDVSSLCLGADFLKPSSPPKSTPKKKKSGANLLFGQTSTSKSQEPSPKARKKAEKEKEKEKEREWQKRARRTTLGERPRTWMGFRSTTDVRETLREDIKPISRDEYYKAKAAAAAAAQPEPAADRDRSWSVSGSFPSFSRRPRGSTSRSPSPPRRRETFNDEHPSKSHSRSGSDGGKLSKKRTLSPDVAPRPTTAAPPTTTTGATAVTTTTATTNTAPLKGLDSTKKISRASAFFLKRPQAFVRGNSADADDSDSCTSSTASLTQTTVEIRVSQPSSDGGDTSATDYTSTASSTSSEMATPKDPLWRAFKMLDSDFVKLQESKTTKARMVVVRNALFPFLKQYAIHTSNRDLKAVDLEFRANVLNKWWNALLDMLDGRATGHIAGGDRPQLLETISMVMMRPEWRQGASFLLPLSDRSPRERVKTRGRSWTTGSDDGSSFDSLGSSGSEFLAESAFHNVRTMFTTNLVKQMVIVVDKVSIRNAPASIVNFAGKACAYAFMFAPAVAEALVRLWDITPDHIRRVADEFKLPRCSHGESDDLVALFPPTLHSLGWTSVKTMSDTLKHEARLPIQVAKVNWHGPWLAKWKGRETDLFYIFCKYFYLLAGEFMPDGLPLVEKARAPAFVQIHAQILTLLDNTIHRQAAFDAMMGPPFGDSAHGADASAMAMAPFGANNLLKDMGENRMVMLLRDFLGDHSATGSEPRQTFAEAFIALVRAATKRTSQFDHNACFTLCDFLEEVLTAYSTLEMHEYDTGKMIDWPFWIDVCRRILDNQNVMSEIRMLSFLFSNWDIIQANSELKLMVCEDWLLTEDVFSRLFTHWSPMVRSYFMRLLCWRICRDTGRAGEADMKIYTLVSTRLKTTWSHYLWLTQKAEMEGKYPPSSAPSYPTPGKKFMIIRTEMPLTPMIGATAPTTFDAFSSPMTTPGGMHAFPSAPLSDPASSEMVSGANELPNGKKRWSLLSRVLTLSNNVPAAARPTTMDEDLDEVRREMNGPSLGPPPPPKPSHATLAANSSADSSAASSPAVYDDPRYIFRFVLSWCGPNAMPPRERMLYTPRLPGPAQARLNNRMGTDASTSMPAILPTRRYSGLAMTGLVAEARNADPSAEVPDDSSQSPRASMSSFSGRPSFSHSRNSSVESFLAGSYFYNGQRPPVNQDDVPCKPRTTERMVQSKYSGKALAEWAVVVLECNGFVERRRNEGVFGLANVEIPSLGVEGLRKI